MPCPKLDYPVRLAAAAQSCARAHAPSMADTVVLPVLLGHSNLVPVAAYPAVLSSVQTPAHLALHAHLLH